MSDTESYDLIATTLFGLEEVLAKELETLGASEIQLLNRAVKYRGDTSLMYRSNLHLRTALRILKPIALFEARNERELYEGVRQTDWREYMSVDQTLAIDAVTSGQVFRHSRFAALKMKDAIVDQFREKRGRRPSINVDDPDLRLSLHITGTSVTLSLDSSGIPLDKRGYRLSRTHAPLNEVLAAGILAWTGWQADTPLLDPMCGSGTLVIEAAQLASSIAPGLYRSFAFEKWNDFDRDVWDSLLQEARMQKKPAGVSLRGYDKSRSALSIARSNADRAGVVDAITWERHDFMRTEAPFETGLLVTNPPYGERLSQPDIEQFYADLGTHLKHHYEGYTAWVFSGNLDALKHVGLRPSRKIALQNGPIACKLHRYDLYAGSKKQRTP